MTSQKAQKRGPKIKEKENHKEMRNIGVLFLILNVCYGCTTNEVYSEYKSLPRYWPKEEIVQFNLANLDTTTNYHVFLNIRNTNAFKFNNLFLIVKMNFPNGKVITDTLEYQMAKPDGTWLGIGSSIKENKLWYKENIRFFEKGVYTLQVEQAMRNKNSVEGVTNLEGITDVGISIEASNKQ